MERNQQEQPQEPASPWSARSQASLLREQTLLKERAQVETQFELARKNLEKLKQARQCLIEAVPKQQDGWTLQRLQNNTEEQWEAKAKISSLEEVLAHVEGKIAAEQPSPESTRARAAHQEALAQLVEERLECDREAEKLLKQLRAKLDERAKLTAAIREHAQAVELGADLDAERFDRLLGLLPEGLAGQSQLWAEWLLGRRTDSIRCRARTRLLLPETLPSAGIFELGEEVELAPEEFERLCQEQPDPHDPEWKLIPPKVLSLEGYEQVETQAKRKGWSVQDFLFSSDHERQQRAKEKYEADERRAARESGGFLRIQTEEDER